MGTEKRRKYQIAMMPNSSTIYYLRVMYKSAKFILKMIHISLLLIKVVRVACHFFCLFSFPVLPSSLSSSSGGQRKNVVKNVVWLKK
jgi:hypothetical protein